MITPSTMSERSQSHSKHQEEAHEVVPLWKAISKAAGLISVLPSGDLAELRRARSGSATSPAFWRILYHLEADGVKTGIGRPDRERVWATLLTAMALSYPSAGHDYKIAAGKALAIAGWSEGRTRQLLDARSHILEKHIRRVAQYLSSKGQPANWSQLGDLLFKQSGQEADRVRLRLARDYYGEVYSQENVS